MLTCFFPIDISKYFGQSTADGIQFQFRSIKTDAKHLKEAIDNGQDVANCALPGIGGGGGSTTSTPSKATPSRGAAGRVTKRKQTPLKIESDMDEEDDDDCPQNWSEMDAVDTPSKKRSKTAAATPANNNNNAQRQRNGTPSRRAASKAAATIAAADATAHLSESYSEPEPLSVAPASIFGNPAGSHNSAFNRGAMDSLISGGDSFGGDDGGIDYHYQLDMEDDGEI